MGLFDILRTKRNQTSEISVSKTSSFKSGNYRIHGDLDDLIWFLNGSKKNYNLKKSKVSKSKFKVNGITFTIETSLISNVEPSLIDVDLVIANDNDYLVAALPYYPSYKDIYPEQRGKYLRFLTNPYDTNFEIGYVFILYYGLERFLLSDMYEKAFDVILKLRNVHRNLSFQKYSGDALVLSCLYHQRADMLLNFLKSLDNDYELKFSDNLFLLSVYSFSISLYAKDIVRLSKTFGFTNKNYISKYPDLFIETMKSLMIEIWLKDHVVLSEIITDTEYKKLKIEDFVMFANTSISNKTIKVPLVSESPKLKKTMFDLLNGTHNSVKEKLAQLRKEGKLPKPNNDSTNKRKVIELSDDD